MANRGLIRPALTHGRARRAAPRFVHGLEALLAHPLEGRKVVGQHPVEPRGLRAPRQIRGRAAYGAGGATTRGGVPTIAGADPAAARSMSSDEDHDRCRVAGSAAL